MVSGVQLSDGKVQKADIYVMALGIMANPLGRSVGLNLPVYPLKGNIVTVPLKVNSLWVQTPKKRESQYTMWLMIKSPSIYRQFWTISPHEFWLVS